MRVRLANLAEPADAAALVELLALYACELQGGGEPLSPEVLAVLPQRLNAQPGARVFLALVGDRAAGVAVCLASFSTFLARPLWNLHDLAVHPEFRGQGIGARLLETIEREARAAGCCKITLEVRTDNRAQRLYERHGYANGEPGTPTVAFLTKVLD